MAKTAKLVRMILPDHECPFGLRAKQMLEQAGYEIEEQILKTREEVDAYEAELGVDTTPQVFIDGKHIGGSAPLERYLAEQSD
ncbi:MAG: glutaredoxin domain-containing protein [Sphingomicrobium sp.]